MKRRYFRIVIAGIIFILALLLTLYPVISNLYNQRHQSIIHTAYEEVLRQADTEDLERIWEQAVSYNESIIPGTAGEAYSQEALLEASQDYESQLDLSGNGIMGYIEIPAICVNLPIYHGTDASTLDRGTGHLLGSSLPVGGPGTHAIITGHSGLASQKMFTDLEQLQEGDVFYLHVLNEVLAYQVKAVNKVLPHDTTLLGISPGEDLCTLVTCYPTGVNTHRLLVRGERIPLETGEEEQTPAEQRPSAPASKWEDQYMLGVWLGIFGMLVAALVYILYRMYRSRLKRRRRKGGRYVKKNEPQYR